MKYKEMKGISRIDSSDTHGWLVRLYSKGNTYSKLFSDSKFETKEHAFIKALMYRLNQEDIYHHERYHTHLQSRNSSGFPGVAVSKRKDKMGKQYFHFIATWIDENHKLKSKSFSSKKYGPEKAFELAKAYRLKMTST